MLKPEMFLWEGLVLLALIAVLALVFGSAYKRFRGKRVITCPENHRPAGVVVDGRHVLATALHKHPDLRLKSCSRWPERQDCGQECLSQIDAAPEDCLVRNILNDWYHGKNCAVCGKPIGEIHWADHQPALLDTERNSVDWRDVPAEQVFDTLSTHQPVCWQCHVMNRMLHEHGELVLDRARHI